MPHCRVWPFPASQGGDELVMESQWQAVVMGSPPVESGGSQGHWAQRLCEAEMASPLYRLDS